MEVVQIIIGGIYFLAEGRFLLLHRPQTGNLGDGGGWVCGSDISDYKRRGRAGGFAVRDWFLLASFRRAAHRNDMLAGFLSGITTPRGRGLAMTFLAWDASRLKDAAPLSNASRLSDAQHRKSLRRLPEALFCCIAVDSPAAISISAEMEAGYALRRSFMIPIPLIPSSAPNWKKAGSGTGL